MKPQPRHEPGRDNLAAGDLEWYPLPNGQHCVRYRRPDGTALTPFKGTAEEAEKVFFDWKADLENRVTLKKLTQQETPEADGRRPPE